MYTGKKKYEKRRKKKQIDIKEMIPAIAHIQNACYSQAPCPYIDNSTRDGVECDRCEHGTLYVF